MRIAILGIKGLPSRFGADRVVENIVRELSARHQLTVYACGKLYPERPHFENFRQVYVPSLPGKHLRMASMLLFSAVHLLLRGGQDVVHLHNFEAGFVVPLLRLRYPVVVTSHGTAYKLAKWGRTAKAIMRLCDDLAIRFSNAVTAVSQTHAQRYTRRYGVETGWIPNGVQCPLPCNREAGRARLEAQGAPADGFILFMAGRIIYDKGCHDLLAAMDGIEPAVPVVIVGDAASQPDYESHLRRQAPPGTHFLGFVADQATLFGIAARSRLFVFPSRYEAMSMMLLEVASLGVPALVSDIPENRAVLTDEHVTFFRAGDTADLREKMQQCLRDAEGSRTKAQACQAHVGATYAWSRIASAYERMYARAVGERVTARQDP